MSEECAPYITSPFDQPALPGTMEEARRARRDFTSQVNRAAKAEEQAERLEQKLQQVQQAAWDLCRAANELSETKADLPHLKAIGGPEKEMKDYHQALRQLAHLISYPGWYQL